MNFNKHSELKGQHALFSPSQNAWLRYDDEQIVGRIVNQYRTALGTEIHEFVAQQISLCHKMTSLKSVVHGVESMIYTKYGIANGDKLADYGMKLLNALPSVPKEAFVTAMQYVNDGINLRMTVEQPLYYSEYCFGTADTISFRDGVLRIHDYKSGDKPAGMDQLKVYAALFCLEYGVRPKEIGIELRLYQFGEVIVENANPKEIEEIIQRIVFVNKTAEKQQSKV